MKACLQLNYNSVPEKINLVQSRDNQIGGPFHHDIDGKTHTHGYNTRAKGKANNVAQGGGLQQNPSRSSVKKAERNAAGLSHTPAELCKKQHDNPDICPVLKWKE